MDAWSVLEQFTSKQGWNEETQLALVMEYIENQQDHDAFAEFLATKVAETEQEEAP
jgi:hypothetical protein